jgi:hypothetical protein
MKRAPAGKKGVALAKRSQARLDALDRLPENATIEEIKEASVNVSLAELEERVADVRDSWETDSLFEDALEELTEESGVYSGSKLPLISHHFSLVAFISSAFYLFDLLIVSTTLKTDLELHYCLLLRFCRAYRIRGRAVSAGVASFLPSLA